MSNNNWIIEKLEELKTSEFLVFRERSYSYADFISNINIWKHKLKDLGVVEGECIALIGDYSPNAIFLFLALVLNKNIIVPLAKESQEQLDEKISVAKVEKYFEFNMEDNWKFTVVSKISDIPLLDILRQKKESGLIIFTSGTSGKSKAAVLSIPRLIEKYKTNTRKPFRTLIFLKLDHIGGVNTLFSIMFNGGTIITSENRTPQAVCEVIQNKKIELLPTTPTFLNMLLMAKSYQNYNMSSLKVISYGTEPMPQSTLDAVNNLFPQINIKQTYGLTEMGIFSTKSKENSSNWLKVGGKGIEIKVVDNILWVKARSAMLGYLNAPYPFDDKGWYDTGDEVEVDGEYLRILGRKSEIINVGGEKVYPAEIESVLHEIPNIKDVLVTGKNSPVTGQIVTATVVIEHPEEIKNLKRRILGYCKERLSPYKIPTLITISDKELVGDRFKKIRC